MYRVQSRFRSEWPAPEELQVAAALKAYCFDTDRTFLTDFVPTAALYHHYLQFRRGLEVTDDGPCQLSVRQFGVALRRVFDLEPERKARRRCGPGKKLVWGFIGVRGPASFMVRAGPGNPMLGTDEWENKYREKTQAAWKAADAKRYVEI